MIKTVTAREVLEMYAACMSVGGYRSRTFQTEIIINRERLKDFIPAIEEGQKPRVEFLQYIKEVSALTGDERVRFIEDNKKLIADRALQLAEYEASLNDLITITPYKISCFPIGEKNTLPFETVFKLSPAIVDISETNTLITIKNTAIYDLRNHLFSLFDIANNDFNAAFLPILKKLKEKQREFFKNPLYESYSAYLVEARMMAYLFATKDDRGIPITTNGLIAIESDKKAEYEDCIREINQTHGVEIKRWSEFLSGETSVYVSALRMTDIPDDVDGAQMHVLAPFLFKPIGHEDH